MNSREDIVQSRLRAEHRRGEHRNGRRAEGCLYCERARRGAEGESRRAGSGMDARSARERGKDHAVVVTEDGRHCWHFESGSGFNFGDPYLTALQRPGTTSASGLAGCVTSAG